MSVAIALAFEPAGLVTGGFSGLAIIIKDMSRGWINGGIPLWLTNTVLNIPLILAGAFIKGKGFVLRTAFGAVALSFWLGVIPVRELITGDVLLSAIIGGALQGVGIGLVFLGRGTTGGSDALAALIQHRLRHYSLAQLMQAVDAVIVTAGAFVFGLNRALYAIIAIFIIAKVSDGLIEGMKFAKVAYIITDRTDEIAEILLEQLSRGVTAVPARGMYSGKNKTMLFCVVSKKQMVVLKEMVYRVDPQAFVIVSDAREVLGEGFIQAKS